jgi:hypothetical protein
LTAGSRDDLNMSLIVPGIDLDALAPDLERRASTTAVRA